VNQIVVDFDIDEEDRFSLMNAQHIIARMVGFYKWTDLIKASETELELAKLLFDNQDKINLEEWKMYIADAERHNKTTFDSDQRLTIFKHNFLNRSMFPDYRLNS